MTIEIELKFLVNPKNSQNIQSHFAAWPHRHIAPVALTNIYFETPENTLRQWDMGLRIRGQNQRYEMTLKTAGQTIAGLHQRPEYNVPLSQPELELEKLPPQVWPKGTNVQGLAQKLQPLFQTDFHREKWLVTVGSSEIEVAFDQGEVRAGALTRPICEVELELIQGQREDLLQFAYQIIAQGGYRLGSESKAARGYYLAKGAPARQLTTLLAHDAMSMETHAEKLTWLTALLSHWKATEDFWIAEHPEALGQMEETLATLGQLDSVFTDLAFQPAIAEMKATLQSLTDQLATAEAHELCYSSTWTQAQLRLTQFIVEQQDPNQLS